MDSLGPNGHKIVNSKQLLLKFSISKIEYSQITPKESSFSFTKIYSLKNYFENFRISKNNITCVEVAKVPCRY
jgi:hypothetical protein